MATRNPTRNDDIRWRGFLPGLVLGLVVGAFAGAILPPILSQQRLPEPKQGLWEGSGADRRDSRPGEALSGVETEQPEAEPPVEPAQSPAEDGERAPREQADGESGGG